MIEEMSLVVAGALVGWFACALLSARRLTEEIDRLKKGRK